MDGINITVTMPIKEYEDLKACANGFYELAGILERANPDGKSAIMTDELKQRILDIYL